MKTKRIALALIIVLLLSLCSCFGGGTYTAEAPFEIHFIDVGQADSAVVLCDGKVMLVDGGNVEDSSLVYTYLQKLGVKYIDVVVCTHAHEDHVGGLSGALSLAAPGVVYAPVKAYDSDAFRGFTQKLSERGVGITVPEIPFSFRIGKAEVTFIAPVNQYSDTNNTSLVMRIVYGDTSFLLTGDAEYDSEKDMLDSGATLKSDVLKVGHHGSDTSTCYSFLREVAPDYAVISVGKDNSYGHPGENTLSRLRDAGATVLRTDELHDIICRSDGKSITFNREVKVPETSGRTDKYIGNVKSHIFHCKDCASLPVEKNRTYFATRDDAVNAGYKPCSNCNP